MDGFDRLLERFFWRPDEDVSGVFAPARGVTAEPRTLTDDPSQELLVFRLEDERFATRLSQVREILRIPPISEVPRGPRHVLGVIGLRGEVLPVYDLKARLGLAPPSLAQVAPGAPPPPRQARVVVVRSELGDAGIWVDEVWGVRRVSASRLERPPRGMGHEGDCLLGLVREEGALFALLDLEGALAPAEDA